jgi:hypothetical protein
LKTILKFLISGGKKKKVSGYNNDIIKNKRNREGGREIVKLAKKIFTFKFFFSEVVFFLKLS